MNLFGCTLILSLLLSMGMTHAQESQDNTKLKGNNNASPSTWTAKTNQLYNATHTLNLGVETRLYEKYSLDICVNWNPWTFTANRKFKLIAIQPELRYWVNDSFDGHFVGTHLTYIHYNIGKVNFPLGIFPELKKHRYQGNAYGFGVSYGYQWKLSTLWRMEATLGLGALYVDYRKYECSICAKQISEGNQYYFGPTKAAISLIYKIN